MAQGLRDGQGEIVCRDGSVIKWSLGVKVGVSAAVYMRRLMV